MPVMTGRIICHNLAGMKRGEDFIPIGSAIAGAAMLSAAAISIIVDYSARPKGLTSLSAAVVTIAVAAMVRFTRFVWTMWRANVPQPIARIRSSFRPALADFAPIVAGVFIIGAFLFSLTYLKSMMIAVVPFWADAPLAAIDRAFLIDPQGLGLALRPALPAIGLFYGLWHVAHLGGILWVLHWRGEERSRFIISFMLTWGIGMIVAYAFSSAGPLFTGRYDLAIAPESVRKPAEFLWANYKARGALLGGGISAFPSLHVGIATWFALVLRQRGWPKVGIAYALAIFACSVILGWHYTIDGVAGALIALLAHRLAAVLIDWRRRETLKLSPTVTSTVF